MVRELYRPSGQEHESNGAEDAGADRLNGQLVLPDVDESGDVRAPEDDWLARRLETATGARLTLGLREGGTTGYREVNSEGDGLPGLVVDRYGETRVVQLTTASMATRREQIMDRLADGVSHVVCVVPDAVARHEGIAAGRPLGGSSYQCRVEPGGWRVATGPSRHRRGPGPVGEASTRRPGRDLTRIFACPLVWTRPVWPPRKFS